MKYGIIQKTTEVDNITTEINQFGQLQIKGGAVTPNLLGSGFDVSLLFFNKLLNQTLTTSNLTIPDGAKKIILISNNSFGLALKINGLSSGYVGIYQDGISNAVTSSTSGVEIGVSNGHFYLILEVLKNSLIWYGQGRRTGIVKYNGYNTNVITSINTLSLNNNSLSNVDIYYLK